MSDRIKIHDLAQIDAALSVMADEIYNRHQETPVLIGIRRGGVPIAEHLSDLLSPKYGHKPQLGIVDINLYRDDWTKARSFPKVGRTEIPISLEERRVILVDDVLFTGRTVRAALDVLTEFGRPARVELACLVDRGHREMPIQADYTSFVIKTTAQEIVEVDFSKNGRSEGISLIRTNID
ncbi:MAG: bifunctional pyr operon transcriptional regulator/uracil phosphoribosyltransferase PyrR [Deltaproteobacteria bacterium]|jgi:pyrimidine operon attenuation protein/uracil phosphoribosyltransferase|nr:bifunctional pyr operon transcriptional regulator/uracil phosphoribosyltransferase PyrR [Deltaproteobacteria bacterium]